MGGYINAHTSRGNRYYVRVLENDVALGLMH
jgi:hypothetical protein